MSAREPSPGWLENALSSRRPRPRVGSASRGDDLTRPSVGELRLLQHMDSRKGSARLGLVVDVDDDLSAGDILLLSPLVEFRAAGDYLLEPTDSGATMPLLVETDLRGAAWFVQFGPMVGRVDAATAHALDQVGAGVSPRDVGLAPSSFGLPARDERDPRWGWKLGELEALNALTAECDQWIVDGTRQPGVLDAEVFRDLAGRGGDIAEEALRMLQLAEADDAWLTDDSLESLEALLATTGPDMQMALRPLFERGLAHARRATTAPRSAAEWIGTSASEQPGAPGLAQAVVDRSAGFYRCVSVITSEDSWMSKEWQRRRALSVRAPDDRRIQVRCRSIDREASEVAA